MPLSHSLSLLNALPEPVLLVGGDARILAANAAGEDLFGRGLEARHYVAALRQPAILDCIEAVLEGRERKAVADYSATRASREVTWRVTAAAVELETGPAVLVSFADITDKREAGQIRRDFVANVSHELRTPLTALIGFIETLKGAARDDAAARARFLSIMEAEAGRMNRLVRDLLSLSRVEAEERVRPETKVDVAAIARTALSSFRPLAEESGVAMELLGAETPAFVPGDADQIAQVAANLVENALKYGGRRVTIEVTRRDSEPAVRGPAVILSVRDEGEGIDPIHIPRLTERFYRVDTHRSRELGGTGLGLAIVKHIVNRHRGRLKIESDPGQGSRFSVILPGSADVEPSPATRAAGTVPGS